jgi:hypothetical protein
VIFHPQSHIPSLIKTKTSEKFQNRKILQHT